MKRRAFQVVDLAFGDSGKGTFVDYLCALHGADLNVRFNGGPQAGHNVVLPDGRHHTFAQFGSGMFNPSIRTLLSQFMLIEPYAMLKEAAHLARLGMPGPMERTLIDPRCRVITPPQQIFNRLRERARGNHRHGTCGMGIGECMDDSISHPELTLRAGDLNNAAAVRRMLQNGVDFKRSSLGELRNHACGEELRVFDEPSWINVAVEAYQAVAKRASIVPPDQAGQLIANSACAIFEGAQGVLLDEYHGFAPHTTWSTTTFANADALIGDASDVERVRIGVMRCYLTRHGAGALVTEDQTLKSVLPEPHNTDNGWPGAFRLGILDFVMLRYAIEACGGLDALAITHLDRLRSLPARACEGYLLDDKVWPQDDLQKMREQPELLSKVVPVYRPLPVDTLENFAQAVLSKFAITAGYGSTGSTRLDKRELLMKKS